MIRKLLAATAALLCGAFLLSACGGVDPKVEEPLVRQFVRELTRALIQNDKERIASYILPMAGQRGNPVGAQEWDTPEGREKIREGNRRQLRQLLLDAAVMSEEQLKTGIVDDGKIDRLDRALRVYVDGKNAKAYFEIAGGPRRMAEDVWLYFAKVDNVWRLADYSRDLKPR